MRRPRVLRALSLACVVAASPAHAEPDLRPATAAAAPSATSAPPEPLASAPAKPKPAVTTLTADINLTTQQMTVTSGGKVLHVWPISSGRQGYDTPRGTFHPQWAAKMHYSKQYDDAPMPHSVFFNGGIATHGTQATGLLGRPASHGCVRLAPSSAATFYALVHQHGYAATRIVVRGTPKPREEMVAQRSYREPRDQAGRGYPPMYRSYAYQAPSYGIFGAPTYAYPGDVQVVRRAPRYQLPGYVRY